MTHRGNHSVVRVPKDGRVTIPKEIRKTLGIDEGGTVLFRVEGKKVSLHGIPHKPFEEVAGCLKKYAKKYVPLDEIRKKIADEIVAEIAQEGLDFPVIEEAGQEGNKIK